MHSVGGEGLGGITGDARDEGRSLSQAPSMPLYPDAFIADTQHLSLEERGAYMHILMVTWRANGKPLIDDAKRMALVLGVSIAKWLKLRAVLVSLFDLSDGTFRQKRLEKEWEKRQEFRDKQSDKGKKSAVVKALNNNRTSQTAVATTVEPNTQPDGNLRARSVSVSKEPKGSKDILFDEFYSIFPRKKAPDDARKAWDAAIKRDTLENIIDGAKRYAVEKAGTEKQFIAYPASWLRAGSWRDEPEAPVPLAAKPVYGSKPQEVFRTPDFAPSENIPESERLPKAEADLLFAEARRNLAAVGANGKHLKFAGVRR